MALKFREVKIRAGTGGDLRLGVMKEEQSEIEQRARNRSAVDQEMLFVKVPSARPDEQTPRAWDSACIACLRARCIRCVRAHGINRLRCPSMQLVQVGEFESSKSAMKTLAPELSALMIILRSGGPVISTRRSSEVGGNGRYFPRGLSSWTSCFEEMRQFAGVEPRLAVLAFL